MRTFIAVIIIIFSLQAMAQNTNTSIWKQADSLADIGQMESALNIVTKIYDESKAANASGQFVKASLYRIKLEAAYQENYFENAIARTHADIETAQSPVKQILHSVLAELYWRYYQQNRWQIMNRSVTAEMLSDDIATWDMQKLVAECVANYEMSLAEAAILKNTPLEKFDEILIPVEDSKKYRPTLFDFLAHRAVDFYSNEESGLTQPAVRFNLNKPEFFAPATNFASLVITSPDLSSFHYKALVLLQRLEGFHLGDSDPTALIDVQLERLDFMNEKSTLAGKDSLYLTALQQLEKQFVAWPSSTQISYKIALQLSQDQLQPRPMDEKQATDLVDSVKKWNKKKAVEICEQAVKRFPGSEGANNCKALIAQIKQPSVDLTADYAAVPGKPALALVSYANVQKIYLRILKFDPWTDRSLLEKDQAERNKVYLRTKVLLAWEQTLPDDGDYRSHSTEIKLPALPAGYYILLGSTDAGFAENSGILFVNRTWRTNISYISRNDGEGNNEVFVLSRSDGQALAGVTAQAKYRNYNPRSSRYENTSGPAVKTNKEGYALIAASGQPQRSQYYLVFKTKKDFFITEDYFSGYPYRQPEERMRTETRFFTDRSIYRPGQTIYFKGIVLDRKGDDVKIKPGYTTEVTFYDVNGQKVSSQEFKTNDYGSFNGSFAAPQGILTGSMTLRCETGSVQVQVEEYKRPKFEVTFETVKGAYKLGEKITVDGKALSYAGSSVSGAQVAYRVVCKTHYPWYGWWRRWYPQTPDVEIAEGTAVAAANGTFSITFTAVPGNETGSTGDSYFEYEITADVTDINGESHSAQTSVSAGYKALLLSTSLADEVNTEKGISFRLGATNLNNEPQPAKGTINIAKLASPGEVIYSRKWSKPDVFVMSRAEFKKDFPNEVFDNEDDITTWAKTKVIYTGQFSLPSDSVIQSSADFAPGAYLLEIVSKDAFGQEVVYKKYFTTFKPAATETPGLSPAFFTLLTPSAQPGQLASFLTGTPERKTRVLYEVYTKDKLLNRNWLTINAEQRLLTVQVTEEMRGNFGINLLFVKNNRCFQISRLVEVPFDNKKLNITFSTFRSKLLPGQQEEWQIKITDSKQNAAAAEMLATMYDASLDAFLPHSWGFDIFRSFTGMHSWQASSPFGTRGSEIMYNHYDYLPVSMHGYDQLNWFGFDYYGGPIMIRGMRGGAEMDMMYTKSANAKEMGNEMPQAEMAQKDENAPQPPAAPADRDTRPKQETPPVQVRKDFNETAFFLPQMATNEKGEIVLKYKAPEALTRWKMMGLAYSKGLDYGMVEKTLVTQKDLMIFTNVPRFLREGDKLTFAAKISNISDRNLAGTAELQLFDAYTMQPVDDKFGLSKSQVSFEVKTGESTPVSWEIKVPEALQAVAYRIMATSGRFSDGEEAALPVLTNRMLVTESMPLPVKALQQKTFNFDKLLKSGSKLSTLRNYRLTLEYTSNPAWYAVQALPYLMEYPYECAEQLFSRYYANSLATHIANSDPKIKRIFESWKNISPDALKSNLEKNEELKALLLQESPWVREAKDESERKQRIAVLFDLNRMSAEQTATLKKLHDMQGGNGGWPWFAGMPESRYITQHIITGMAHLGFLDVINLSENAEVHDMLQKAVAFTDAEVLKSYEKLKKDDKDYLKNNHLGYDDIHYLYGRTYLLADFPLGAEMKEAISYYRSQSEKYWKTNNNYMKAMIALYEKRFGDTKTANLVMKSLSQTALHSDEMGMYWRTDKSGWWWYQAPVETQAMMIEAFDEVLNDRKAVDEMNIWLLKQKQTQDWKTTKATTEAVYALLLRGTSLLSSDKLAEITVGTEKVDPYQSDNSKPEAGTGYFKTSWDAASITPQMGKVTVNNPNNTIAWGSIYWQYYEQLDKITPAETPLKLSKKLFREVNTPTGPVIEAVSENNPLNVGDKVVVRVELRADRDMEYIHLKDMRASAFEPVNVLSGYRWQGGLGYYESTRDASTNFFISYLPKGTYVFEYKLMATQKGDFSNGITSVQCMYAPEFAAHSEGVRIQVK